MALVRRLSHLCQDSIARLCVCNTIHVVLLLTLRCCCATDFRNKLKFFDKMRKRMQTNPTRGPFHFRAPSRILFHTIRGMLPHKTYRGKQALARLKVRGGVDIASLSFGSIISLPCSPAVLRCSRASPLRLTRRSALWFPRLCVSLA